MRIKFAEVTKDDYRFDRALTLVPGRAYKFNETADYGIGAVGKITTKDAQDVIDVVERFVDTIARLLASA